MLALEAVGSSVISSTKSLNAAICSESDSSDLSSPNVLSIISFANSFISLLLIPGDGDGLDPPLLSSSPPSESSSPPLPPPGGSSSSSTYLYTMLARLEAIEEQSSEVSGIPPCFFRSLSICLSGLSNSESSSSVTLAGYLSILVMRSSRRFCAFSSSPTGVWFLSNK